MYNGGERTKVSEDRWGIGGKECGLGERGSVDGKQRALGWREKDEGCRERGTRVYGEKAWVVWEWQMGEVFVTAPFSKTNAYSPSESVWFIFNLRKN